MLLMQSIVNAYARVSDLEDVSCKISLKIACDLMPGFEMLASNVRT